MIWASGESLELRFAAATSPKEPVQATDVLASVSLQHETLVVGGRIWADPRSSHVPVHRGSASAAVADASAPERGHRTRRSAPQNLSPRFGEPDSATPNVVFSSDFRVMVRRGSPVRVRKRALKSPQNGFSCCLDWYNRAPPGYGGTRRGGRGRQHCAQPSPGRTKVGRACQTRRRATPSDTHKPAPLHANPHESTPSAFLELF